jgi:hypothetical protein
MFSLTPPIMECIFSYLSIYDLDILTHGILTMVGIFTRINGSPPGMLLSYLTISEKLEIITNTRRAIQDSPSNRPHFKN